MAGLAAGCRPAERVAWAADAQGVALLAHSHGGWSAPSSLLQEQRGFALYLSGMLAEMDGKLEIALDRYKQAHDQQPQSVQILLRQGLVELQLNDISAAENSLSRVSQLDSADLRSRFVLGVLYTQQERLEEAAQQYAQVLIQDPANLGALNQLAELYVLQERVQEGLSVYERLLKEKPNSAVLHFTIGVLYAKAEQWDEAVGHMGKAVELDPNYLEARLGLAVSLELAGEVDRAREEFLRALELEPANTQLIYYLAQISRRLGNVDETAQWLGRYLSFKPRDPEALVELALVRIEQNRWQEAVQVLQPALIPVVPGVETAQLWMVIGMAYESGRKFEAAEQAYRQSVLAAPDAVEPLLHLAILYHRQKQYEAAEQVCQKAFQLDPDHPEVLNSLGFLYADWGVHLEEAMELIERALAQNPHNGAYLDSLGWATFKSGKPQEALKLLEEAAQRMEDGEILDHLGQVYLSLGKLKEAEQAFSHGLAVEKKDQDVIDQLKSHRDALHSTTRKD